ncbi:unnamed protein product [Pylaiella littoralis]
MVSSATASADEHAAPGEEQVVFSRTAGVVASKVSYMGLLDEANEWQVLKSPHEDKAVPLACQFNHRGTHLVVGDEWGRIDLWSFVPLRQYVKSLDLTPELLDKLLSPRPFTENANGNSRGTEAARGEGAKDDKDGEDTEHGWSAASVHWSRCSRYVMAAYVQKRKTWPDGEEVLLPGLVILWNVLEAQVEGYLRLQSRVVHVSLSPKDPRRGSVCCLDGTSFVVIFPVGAATAAVTTAVNMAAAGGSTDFPVAPRGGPSLLPGGDGGGPGEQQRGKCACSSDGSSVTSEAVASEGEGGGNSAEKHGLVGAKDEGDGTAINVEQLAAGGGGGGGIDNCLSDPLTPAAAAARGRGREKSDDDAMDVDRPFGDISADKSLTGPLSAAEAEESLSAAVTTTASERNNGKLLMGNMEKLWDPVLQMDLFSCSSFSSSFSTTTTAGVAPPAAAVDPGSSNGRGTEDPGNCLELGTGNDYSCDTSAGNKNKNNKNNSGAGAAGGGGAGACSGAGSGGLKATSKIPFQACRVTWCEDGETLFLLNHAGNLLKVKAALDGALSVLARADLPGGASPATLQLSPAGDKLLLATATKGLCLVPTRDLDLSQAEMFGENLGIRGPKTRFWGAAALGNIHGRGPDGNGRRRLTVVANPSRTRDDKTDLFFFDDVGEQPTRVDMPRREGVLSLACSPYGPLLLFLCPTGEIYYREEVLKTDFPGPWYPSGYVLIDNNVDYLEAEDQLDTVVMTGPEGEVLSKTQAHEVVVPWQHEAVAEAEASVGTQEEPVDVESGESTGKELWTDPCPNELRWIPVDEDTWPSDGEDEEGSGGPRGSPRSGQESSGGPLARLLGATPMIFKEARKRFRGAGSSDKDTAEKRRKMVPTMLQDLAAKKTKYDEEAVKRKRKQEETRARAKRNRDKKAAAEAVAAAERARAAVEEAAEKTAAEEAKEEEDEAARKENEAAASMAALAETAEKEVAGRQATTGAANTLSATTGGRDAGEGDGDGVAMAFWPSDGGSGSGSGGDGLTCDPNTGGCSGRQCYSPLASVVGSAHSSFVAGSGGAISCCGSGAPVVRGAAADVAARLAAAAPQGEKSPTGGVSTLACSHVGGAGVYPERHEYSGGFEASARAAAGYGGRSGGGSEHCGRRPSPDGSLRGCGGRVGSEENSGDCSLSVDCRHVGGTTKQSAEGRSGGRSPEMSPELSFLTRRMSPSSSEGVGASSPSISRGEERGRLSYASPPTNASSSSWSRLSPSKSKQQIRSSASDLLIPVVQQHCLPSPPPSSPSTSGGGGHLRQQQQQPYTFRGVSILAHAMAHGRPESLTTAGDGLPRQPGPQSPVGSPRLHNGAVIGAAPADEEDAGVNASSSAKVTRDNSWGGGSSSLSHGVHHGDVGGVGSQQSRQGAGGENRKGGVEAGVEMLADAVARQLK